MNGTNGDYMRSVYLIPPPEVRLLPMDSEIEFAGKSTKWMQEEFFLKELPGREDNADAYDLEDDKTYYRYMTSGLVAPRRSVVLFQFQAKVIACAEFIRRVKFHTQEMYCTVCESSWYGDDPPTCVRCAQQGKPDSTILQFYGVFIFRVPTICVFTPWDEDYMRRCWPDFGHFSQVKQFLKPPANFDCFIRHCRNVRHA